MPTPTIDELFLADEPANWAALGFEVADGVCDLGAVRISFRGSEQGGGLLGWSLRNLESGELDGLPTTVSGAPARPPALEHPNGVLAIDHLVAVSPALERTIDALRLAGLDLRRVREEPTPAGAPRQAFFRLGREILEVVQEPDEVIERSGGADRPTHFWGLALLVEDLDRTLGRLGEHAGAPRPAVQPGRRIATVRRSAGLAVPLALISTAQDGADGAQLGRRGGRRVSEARWSAVDEYISERLLGDDAALESAQREARPRGCRRSPCRHPRESSCT